MHFWTQFLKMFFSHFIYIRKNILQCPRTSALLFLLSTHLDPSPVVHSTLLIPEELCFHAGTCIYSELFVAGIEDMLLDMSMMRYYCGIALCSAVAHL